MAGAVTRGCALVVVEGGGQREVFTSRNSPRDPDIVKAISDLLIDQTNRDRCASVVVSVHWQDERCDHEVAP